jgi:hypothetical protein
MKRLVHWLINRHNIEYRDCDCCWCRLAYLLLHKFDLY